MSRSYKTIVSTLAMIGTIMFTIGMTLAFFSYAKEGTIDNTLTTGSLTFLYTEVSGVGRGISIENAYPVTDEVGKVQTGEGKVFDFKVTSTTEISANIPYEVTARKTSNSTLDESAVKLYLTTLDGDVETEVLLDNYNNLIQTSKIEADTHTEKVIYMGKVPSGESNYEQNFRLRMWIDKDTDFSDGTMNGKTFTITVNVYSNADSNKQIEARNGVLYDKVYNQEFQIIGINFDNNTWNTAITAINTGHNETSYKEIAAMGINTIRFGLAYNMTLQDNFYEWLDTNIKQAEAAGLKIILDMHGSQGGIQLRDKQASYNFWQSEQLQQQFIDTWVDIAKHYNKNNTVMMYDLLNEPLVVIDEDQDADEKYYEFMNKLIYAIRTVDKQTVLCIEGYSSSVLNYNEDNDETTYVANITNSSKVIQKINDNNIVFDVHNYSPTEYTFQTAETPVAYSDVYSVVDAGSWGQGSDYYIIKTSTVNDWLLYETESYQLTDSNVNYGNIRYTFDKGNEEDTLWIDNVIVEEYDENMNFIRNAYEFSFDKTKYEWNAYGTQNYEIDSQGYDDIGGSLKLTSIGTTGILTLRIDNTGFNVTEGHYYKIKAYIKTTTVLDARNARFSLLFRKVGFAGGLKEISDYNIKKYYDFSNSTSIPMICNEFGLNYNSIKNSDGSTYLYEVLSAAHKYKTNITLFSYSGFDFGLMYDSTRDFGTDKSNIRQESYDALYKAINQDNTYDHIFKNIETMKEYGDLNTGDKLLVLGETLAGVGPKLEYIVVDSPTGNEIKLANGLYALLQ